MKEKYSVYVHIPFCVKRCDYCTFSSSCDFSACGDYFAALFKEIETQKDKKRKIDTIFLGGGTPSAVEEKYIDALFENLDGSFDLSECLEITSEANPESLTSSKLDCFKSNGVNRLSLGLQSVNDSTLERIGRAHTYSDFLRAFGDAQKKGFSNINADLMLGLPESAKDFYRTVDTVSSLGLSHVSLYALELYENSALKEKVRRGMQIIDDGDELADMYDGAREILSDSGFVRYEVSNFAAEGFKCLHNLNYWKEGRYFGFGAAAHSFVQNVRRGNAYDVGDYMKKINTEQCASDESEIITTLEERKEYVMLGLRLDEGILLSDFTGRFNENFFQAFPAANALLKMDILLCREGRVAIAEDRFYALNTVLAELL